jgi:sec-independent protein translocase protein TatA
MLAEILGVDGVIVLIVVLVLLFGGAAIPKLARNLGSAKNEFERGLQDGKDASSKTATPAPSNDGISAEEANAPTPIRAVDHSNSKG